MHDKEMIDVTKGTVRNLIKSAKDDLGFGSTKTDFKSLKAATSAAHADLRTLKKIGDILLKNSGEARCVYKSVKSVLANGASFEAHSLHDVVDRAEKVANVLRTAPAQIATEEQIQAFAWNIVIKEFLKSSIGLRLQAFSSVMK